MPKSNESLNELLYDLRRIEEHREILTEDKIRKIYKSLTKNLNAFVGEEYIKYADSDGKMYVSYLYEKNRYARFLEEIAIRADNFSSDVKDEIMDLVDKTYKACYKGMSEAVKTAEGERLAKIAKDIGVNKNVLKQAVNNNISKLTLPHVMEKHRQEITYQIQQELNIGLINGDRYEKMAKRISERVDVSYSKAMNIVRTESHRNIEGGFMDCAERIQESIDDDDELVYCATWRTMQDERVRPNQRVRTKKGWRTYRSKNGADHQKMEGVTVKAGDMFDLGNGAKTKEPGNSGTAANDCNCRCFLEYNFLTVEEYEKATGKRFTKKNKSGKIEEKKSKNAITPITDKAIDNIPYVEIDGYTDEQCRYIQEQHKELLKFARDENNNKEVAFVFSNSLKDKKEYKGEANTLEFGGGLYGKDLLIMHNHPKNSGFSGLDIATFLKSEQIDTMTIVKNNGNIETIHKNNKFILNKAIILFNRLYSKYIKSGTDDEYKKLVKAFLKKEVGIEWEE